MAATSVRVFRVSCTCLLPLGETLQDQQVGLTQAPTQLWLLPWVPEPMRFCMSSLSEVSIFPNLMSCFCPCFLDPCPQMQSPFWLNFICFISLF